MSPQAFQATPVPPSEPESHAPSHTHDKSLAAFWRACPHFLYLPAASAAILECLWHAPPVHASLVSHHMEPWGLASAAQYTAFAILLSFAVHGAACAFLRAGLAGRRMQTRAPFEVSPASAAVRSTAALLTSLLYARLPVRSPSASWAEFWAATAVCAVCWDAYFYAAHRLVHASPWLYRHVHKLHHVHTRPHCFAAFYVTYPSHLLLEHLPVCAFAIAGAPRDVVAWLLYSGAAASFLDHSGFRVDDVSVPFLPCLRLGHALSAVHWYGLPLGLATSAGHDFHHETFRGNYALFFTYLDRLGGTYRAGRGCAEGCKGAAMRHGKDNLLEDGPLVAGKAPAVRRIPSAPAA